VRPVKLEMHAFGPYAGTQVLDFRELGDRPLFLIHGPTGSGKSTILDAICLALYGETSGDERKGGHMRSDYAPPEMRTRVVFEFAIGQETYRIDRRPGQEIPRANGSVQSVGHQVSMYRCFPEVGDDELIASKVGDVSEQVERLLGLRADQFRQVVVLPQGRFRELLTASSNDREKIFATLFQTEHYERIQDRLKERARDIRQNLDHQYSQQRLILANAETESSDALATKIAELEQERATLFTRRSQQETAVENARKSLEQARESDRKLTDVENAQTALNNLLSRKEEIDCQRQTLEQARRAATLADAEANLNRRLKEAEDSERARDRLQEQVGEAEQKLQAAELEKEQVDALQPQLDQHAERKRELEALRPRIRTLADAEQQLNDAGERARQLREKHEQLEQQRETVTEALEQAQQQLQTAKLQASQASGHEATRNHLSRLVRQRSQLETEQENLRQELEAQETASTSLETAGARLAESQRVLDIMEAAWRNGQAAVLARQLEDESPCPVCGSIHHPAPAEHEDDVPDEADLERQRSVVESARNNRDQASRNKITIDGRVQALNERVNDLQGELEGVIDTPAEELRKQRQDAEEKLRVAKEESERVEPLKEQVDALSTSNDQLSDQLTDAQKDLEEARNAEVAAKTSLENAAGEVPDEYRSLEALDAALETVSNHLTELSRRIELAQTELDSAKSEHQRLSAQHQAAAKEAERDRSQATEDAAAFAERRAGQGFETDQDYRAAKLPLEQVDQLDDQINLYDQQVSNATYHLENARKAAEGLAKPDLEALNEVLVTAEAELKGMIEKLAALDSQVGNLKRAGEQLSEIAEQIEELNKQYSVAEYLASVANGEAAYSNYRVSFERFVLSAFLDEVLTYATNRLYSMTNGRFRLLRKTEGGDRRRSTGLDLEIEDAYTGTSRDVSTLSGGEGFLAALSMALGLSEVVQNRAGGIRLQTLFVDEGFGSLDPDALDRSLMTLVDLHHGRLVGIISHVPELQERVNVKLTVEAGKNGSHARFVV
jgi:DNA repair protein SbcC/Rad50